MKERISHEELTRLFSYDPDTGLFTRKISYNKYKEGEVIAGGKTAKGYLRIEINGRKYMAHVLAWFIVKGIWPEQQIDHEDQNKENNKWSNLRPANNSQNKCNSSKKTGNFTSQYKGVSFDKEASLKKPWKAQCQIQGKRKNLGRFATEYEAYTAYCNAAKQEYGEFFNPGTVTL